jgi:hypothetical protein
VPNRIRFFWSLSLTASTLAAAGCTPEIHRYMRFPDFFHPGNAGYQRAEAIEHDPYTLNDIAPPVVGGRPLGYQAGVPEVERARLAAPSPPNLRPIPILSGPAPAPVVVTPFPPGPPPGPPPAAPASMITTPYPPSLPTQPSPWGQP